MSNIFGSIASALGGSIIKDAGDLFTKYFPPDMNPQDAADLKLALRDRELAKDKLVNTALNEAENNLNQRIREQEGTASDLKSIPILGHIVLFLRGVQRPAWGFFTMYLDYEWLVSSTDTYTDQQQTALIVINILVLGFLFGERTIKNLTPLILQVFGSKKRELD